MTNELILQLITAISLYCSGPGERVEIARSVIFGNQATCFQKVWVCTHDTKDAEVLVSRAHNCVTAHLKGELE